MIRTIATVCFLFIEYGSCMNDPCIDSITIPRSKYRGAKCISKSGKEICDKLIPHRWYKTEDNATIATIIPDQFFCGTVHPIWINGSLPDISDGIVNRTACVDYGRDHCEETLDIMVKNCNHGIYTYFLTSPTACDAAYCFGNSKSCPSLDPCDFYYHDNLEDVNRNAECDTRLRSNYCDNLLEDGWYRLIGTNGDTILPTFCPKLNSCGTRYPIWLNDSYPQVSDAIVKRHACLRDENDCCGKKYHIEVKNCTSFYVFNLTKTTGCPERYCFEDLLRNCTVAEAQSTSPDSTRDKNVMIALILILIVPLSTDGFHTCY